MDNNLLNGLTEDQVAKARACTSPSELMELIQSEGVELTDEQLEAVAGGKWNDYGDTREDFDESLVDARFVDGTWEDDGLD